jgi:malate dehydrogenase (oxaloacetate-decarboxylating)
MEQKIREIGVAGPQLLTSSLLNKGSAFSLEERLEFNLLGLLPPHISTMEEQLVRTYENYCRKETDLERYIHLLSLQDRNETLYYRLLLEHISEMMPIVYTPTVGLACQTYSHIYRRPRGLYISYPDRNRIDMILANALHAQVRVIVVTDGERILGLGDLGAGGMGIPIGKLTLYTLCAGIHPATTLPILLDAGTNNSNLIVDPLYLGWRHERIRGQEYDDFIEAFVQAVIRKFPGALLQWEDFSKDNARRLLERYRDRLCTFNDDIQGTGAVTVSGLLAAMEITGSRLSNQRIVILGAGSAATGISDQIVSAMLTEGVSEKEAASSIWLIDSKGLVHTGRPNLESSKQKFAQPLERLGDSKLTNQNAISLEEVVNHVHPTILLGTGAQPGAFTETIVRKMAEHVLRPIIFPLSNPTSKSEAIPADILSWTSGRALVATGSPFPDVEYANSKFTIGQCNNAFIFPGVGLGVIASGASRVTDQMFVAAARALKEFSPILLQASTSLYPKLENVREVASKVALAVALEAQESRLAPIRSENELEKLLKATVWTPEYPRYKLGPHAPENG